MAGNETIKQLRDRVRRLERLVTPQQQFGQVLSELLDGVEDVEVISDATESRGPLGGVSQQIQLAFTDTRGRRHGVFLNAYVGEPDVALIGNEDEGYTVTRGRDRGGRI